VLHYSVTCISMQRDIGFKSATHRNTVLFRLVESGDSNEVELDLIVMMNFSSLVLFDVDMDEKPCSCNAMSFLKIFAFELLPVTVLCMYT